MRGYRMEYRGRATVDGRLSGPMVPWVVAQVLRGPVRTQVEVGLEGGRLVGRAVPGGEVVVSHPVDQVRRPTLAGPLQLIYQILQPDQPLLQLHLYQTDRPNDVVELLNSLKEAGRCREGARSLSSASSLTALCPDISPSSSHFFEVLYIGKIKVSHKKVPETFIDDALDKFHKSEKEKKEKEALLTLGAQDSDEGSTGDLQIIGNAKGSFGSTETLKSDPAFKSDENIPKVLMRKRSGSAGSVLIKKPENLSVAAAALQDHNRTMVFHVGRTDLRLISPDRKQVLLFKHLKDITNSVQGAKHTSHFAFICRENSMEPPGYMSYVFKGQSSSVAEEVVTAINQALASESLKKSIVSCEHCPMMWYHRLCSEIEGLGPSGAQGAAARRLEALPADEQAALAIKLQGALDGVTSPSEQAETLMMILRAHCEAKQARHVHDTPENRHEFLNHYLGGGTIFMKAKRSLTNSFDQLLKRKGSKDDFTPILKEFSLPANATLCKDAVISGSDSSIELNQDEEEKSGSMMNIFLKVGNSPVKNHEEGEREAPEEQPASWRQAIFNTVVTPSKTLPVPKIEKRDKEFYRNLWKKAINQQVLLIRMEKENAKLTARQEEANVKRIKLEYDDLGVVENSEVWDVIVSRECDKRFITQALKQGIPRSKRGEVWMHLAEKFSLKKSTFDSSKFPNYNVSYPSLLKQLTSHQHAILIDLGRTFPNHVYYSSPLGPGQLALFNILKAYSLLDPEVGYCQGLSFIAGVLLLHVSEEQAFLLLRHLMFVVGLRACYVPDMAALQVSLYQLSRLLHDHLPQLYAHLDKYEVSPTLYAAPWLLTIFASQFPLGFVTRIFDIIFAESTDIIFRAALTLLSHHKDGLMACDSFELIMDYLKNKIPNIDRNTMEKIMKEVLSKDISRELWDYGVEYHVLQEEMSTPRPEAKRLKNLEAQNRELIAKNKALTEQLQIASSNINRLESSRSQHMAQMNRLEGEVRGLEVTVATLGEFIQCLAYSRTDLEIPTEILRILTQVSHSQQRRQNEKNKPLRNANRGAPVRVLEETNKPPLKFALSSPNLTAKMSSLFKPSGGSGQGNLEADSHNGASSLKKSLSDTEGCVRVAELTKSRSSGAVGPDVAKFGRILTEEDKKALGVSQNKPADPLPIDEKQQLQEKRRLLKTSQSSYELKTHPLDCDSGVTISFEGTTKLKTIKPPNPASRQRCNSATSDIEVELKIIEQQQAKDPVGWKIKSTMDKVNQLFDSTPPETALFTNGPSNYSGKETDLFLQTQPPSSNKKGLLT